MKDANKTTKEVLANLRALSKEDLEKKIVEFEEEVFGLQLKQRTGQLKSTSDIKKAKKHLARAKTLISEKLPEEAK